MTDERQDGPPEGQLGEFPEDDSLGGRFRKPAYVVRAGAEFPGCDVWMKLLPLEDRIRFRITDPETGKQITHQDVGLAVGEGESSGIPLRHFRDTDGFESILDCIPDRLA